jgi:hypothetical protein
MNYVATVTLAALYGSLLYLSAVMILSSVAWLPWLGSCIAMVTLVHVAYLIRKTCA